MNDVTRIAADRVGAALTAGTKALGEAFSLTCTALVALQEGEVDTNMLGATRREAKKLYDALGTIMEARQSQVHARVMTFRRAQSLEIRGYGENCPCGFSGDTNEDVEARRSAPLALVA